MLLYIYPFALLESLSERHTTAIYGKNIISMGHPDRDAGTR